MTYDQGEPKNPEGRRPVTVQTGKAAQAARAGNPNAKQQPKKPVNYGQYKASSKKKKRKR